nr:5-carboxymethyl-2-hydroxymuconate isomerase [Acinetobacter sp. Marseille-Q1620]
MPQMIVEYSENIQNLDKQQLLSDLNHAVFDTGLIDHPKNIKSRVRIDRDFLIGFGEDDQAYIHVHLYVLTGRNATEKKLLIDKTAEALARFSSYQAHGLEVQLCVELTEMPLVDYRKIVVTG